MLCQRRPGRARNNFDDRGGELIPGCVFGRVLNIVSACVSHVFPTQMELDSCAVGERLRLRRSDEIYWEVELKSCQFRDSASLRVHVRALPLGVQKTHVVFGFRPAPRGPPIYE